VKPAASARIHALEIPTRGASLLFPSAGIAEVVNVAELTPVPFGPPWLLGVTGWRSLAVPVVSFEALLGAAAGRPAPASKVVIFYPLGGRREWEFFGVLSSSEPHPQTIDSAAVTVNASELPDSPLIAAGIKLGNRLQVIPDMAALKQVFYP
jgi:chemotaxis signal transduction protein